MIALADPEPLSVRYQSAQPFPHIAIDEAIDRARLMAVAEELEGARIDPEAPGYGWFGKRRASELAHFPPKIKSLVEELNGPQFIAWLERVTGIQGLQPDPFLEGGGIHQIPPGGYLKVHTDFNWHKRLGLHRRINLLLYLNLDWQEEWGGKIELWDESALESSEGRASASYSPLFNRMVIFSTTDFSYHGHPRPLACPPDRTRNSIALYYYSKERPSSEIRFGHSEMTNYRPVSGDQLGFKHRVHQALIRHPTLRNWLFRVLGKR